MSVMVRFFLVKSFRKGQLDRQSALQGLNLILDFDSSLATVELVAGGLGQGQVVAPVRNVQH